MVQTLGKLMNYDENMSVFKDQACASCHMPYAGFSGPIPSVNLTMVAYPGSFHFRAGKRTAQRYTYSPDVPVLEYNPTQGGFFGGNFWDARSTGYKLQSADAEQAQHPPVDTQEMGFPDAACIARFGYRKRCTGRSLSWFGVRISTSVGRATPSRSAPPREGQRGSAAAPRQFG
jgi:cytochrome c peroxidase